MTLQPDYVAMEYRITKNEMENDLLYDTLKALSKAMDSIGLKLYVVGAVARDLSMKLLGGTKSTRATMDLDVSIAIKDWNQYKAVEKVLEDNHFRKGKPKQKFYYKGEDGTNDYEVDVVPFGEIAEGEAIGWPPDGDPQMSVKCFSDVMAYADTIIIDDLFSLNMAPLSGQFLIKLDAWNDRKIAVDKDANDLVYIMDNYYVTNVTTKIPWPKEVEIPDDASFDSFVWGARWIACEVRDVLSNEHRSFYISLLEKELQAEEDSLLLNHLMKYYSQADGYVIIRRALKDFVSILAGNLV